MKKILSLLLSLVMVLSLTAGINLSAYAEENYEDVVEETTEPSDTEEPLDPEEPAEPEEPTEPEETEDPILPIDPEGPDELVKLEAPSVELIVNDNGTFTLSWDDIKGADKYEIYVLNNTTGNYQLNGTVSKTSATTALAPFGVKYSYMVRAINSEGKALTSDFSDVVTGINNKKLAAPKLSVDVNANGTFTISWNAVAGAEAYELCLRNADGSYRLLRSTTELSLITAVAPYGKEYTYKIRSVTSKNVDAVSDYSEVLTAVNKVFLQTPTLKTVLNNNGTFTLSWNAITGAEQYEVYLKNEDGSYRLLKTTAATSFTTAVAVYNKKYTYRMRAVNSELASSYTSEASLTNNKVLQSPAIKVTVNANGSFTVSWSKITGADKYEIYLKNTDGSYRILKSTTATSFTTSVAAFNKQYSYKAKAISSKNSSINSAYGAVVSAVNNKMLQTPSGVKVAVNKNGSFTISWNKVTGADKYQVYLKNEDGSYRLLKTTTGTSVTTAVAKAGKTYSYKVRAVKNSNSSATSAFSSVVSKKR